MGGTRWWFKGDALPDINAENLPQSTTTPLTGLGRAALIATTSTAQEDYHASLL